MEITEEEQAALAEQASLADTAQLSRMLEALTDCERQLRDAASKKILVEVSLLKAIQAAQAMTLDDVLDKLKDLRAQGASAPVTAPVKTPAKKTKSAPVKQETAANPATADVCALWPGLMEAVGQASGFMRSYFNEAHPVSLEQGVFKIGFPANQGDARELADNPKAHQLLQQELAKLGYADTTIAFVTADRPEDWAAPTLQVEEAPATTVTNKAPAAAPPVEPAPLTHDDFKNDPLIQKALEMFKGQIVDVRT